MELDDCGFPTLQDVIITDDPNKAFAGCNWALLVGAAPRGQGMERKDLLGMNGKIFVGQGQALAKNAAQTCASSSSATRATRTAWSPTATAATSRPSAGTP